jgi:hypothetical protein
VSHGVVWVDLDGSGAIADARVRLLKLEVASSALGEHGGRLRVQLDGLREQVDGFVPERNLSLIFILKF